MVLFYLSELKRFYDQFQIDSDEGKNECVMTYWRFFNNSGFSEDIPFTNSVTYDDFRHGFYFVVFDLSTSSRCNSANLIPGTIYKTFGI